MCIICFFNKLFFQKAASSDIVSTHHYFAPKTRGTFAQLFPAKQFLFVKEAFEKRCD